METIAPTTCRVASVEPGQLFILFGGDKGSPLCLKGEYANDEDEKDRVVPLHWPEDLKSQGVAVYARALNGWAVVLDGACVEVDPESVCAIEVGSMSHVYARDGRLFLPVNGNQGRPRQLIDTGTGEILPFISGDYVAFSKWHISLPQRADRRIIHHICD